MKFISSAAIFLAGLAASSSLKSRAPEPLSITSFVASKPHLSAYTHYSFTVSDQALDIVEAHCSADVDGGFSGYTKLPFVWEGLGKCDSAAVTWTFFQADTGSDATFTVTVGGVKGVYHMPGADISFWVNDEANPFDDDVSYTGPTEFLITEFEERVDVGV